MPGLFITGTDTGVGKTVITATLVAMLRKSGRNAAPMKPVQTGCLPGSSDIDYCLQSVALNPSPDERNLMCPYSFEPACSPHLAAAKSGMTISVNKILECSRQLQQIHETLVVEGAGGALVPLNDSDTMLDLMRQLAFPIVIVARPSLGTLNHTLLTFRALRDAGLSVKAILLNDSVDHPWGEVEKDNQLTLQRLCVTPLVTHFPHCPDAAGDRLSNSALVRATPILQPVLDRLTS